MVLGFEWSDCELALRDVLVIGLTILRCGFGFCEWFRFGCWLGFGMFVCWVASLPFPGGFVSAAAGLSLDGV